MMDIIEIFELRVLRGQKLLFEVAQFLTDAHKFD